MPFVPAPGIISMATIMSWSGERVENTFHYRLAGTITSAELLAIANTYIDWFAAHAGDFSNAVGLELVYLRDLTTQFSQTLDVVPGTTHDGSRASPSLPNNCALAIKRQTGLAGRANRGRVFHIGLTEDLLASSNTVGSASAAGIADNYSTLLLAQQVNNSAHEVILHRKLGTGTDVTGYVVTDFVIDSQRRRLPGHNRHR